MGFSCFVLLLQNNGCYDLMLKGSIGLQVGLWQEAQETLQRMQADGVQPNTVAYNALIKALGSGGQWQQVGRAWTHRQPLRCCTECWLSCTTLVAAKGFVLRLAGYGCL